MSDVEALRAELADLRATVEELRRGATPAADAPVTRRGAFKALGAAAVGAAAGSLALAAPAGALDNGNVIIGNDTQTAESPTVLRVANGTTWSNPGATFGGLGVTDVATGDLPAPGEGVAEASAVFGLTDASAFAYGVGGVSISTGATGGAFYGPLLGLLAVSTDPAGGAGAYFAGADGNLILDIGALDPAGNTGETGLVRAADDVLWYCVSADGADRWRRLTAQNSAGAFTAINPVRVYDSRWTPPVAGLTLGTLNSGASREVSVANGRDPSGGAISSANAVPAGARAIAFTLTIADTTGTGFLKVSPGGSDTDASAINWGAGGALLANSSIVATSSSRTIRVVCGGGGTTSFIVDVAGYWL